MVYLTKVKNALDKEIMKGYSSRRYVGIPIGLYVRRQLAKVWIYRVRRGNGFYNTKVGERIQDRYTYVVPGSINNPEGQHARDVFTAAVAAWQALPEATKTWWDTKVKHLRLVMSGYNLFIRVYMKDNL